MTASQNPWLLARPKVEAAQASDVAEAYFGVSGAAHELGSQQDRNYKIDAAAGSVLLKFDNPEAPAERRELQRQVIAALAAAGLKTPKLLPRAIATDTATGNATATLAQEVTAELQVATDDGQSAVVRAFEWVDGAALEAEPVTSGARAAQLGELAGRTVLALAGPALEQAAKTAAQAEKAPAQWELGNALTVVEELAHYLPEELRATCVTAARAADAAVRDLGEALPRQLIHCDLTTDNVMRDEQGQLWVIDLGDAGVSWRVAELAITAADVLGRTGSIAAVGRTVAGFAAELRRAGAPLTDAEAKALLPLITLRGAVLAVSGWSQLDIDPNNAYARERMDHEWQVFARATALDADAFEAHVRVAAGMPHREGVAYAPIVEGAVTAIDLGVESPLFDRGAWLEADAETAIAAAAQTRLSGSVVAPFGQARMARVAARISEPSLPRARCIELWAPAGAEIRAPFAGTVSVSSVVSEAGSGAQGESEPAGRTLPVIEIEDCGVVLRIIGAAANEAANGETVAQGQVIGRAGETPVRVMRRAAWAGAEAPFAVFDAEYEADGALDPSPLTGLGITAAGDPELERQAEHTRRNAAMGPAAERFYVDPPQFERGWRTLLVETRGRACLDLVNNVAAIGHSHPVLADRVGAQLLKLNTNSRFLYRAYADFTEKLLANVSDDELDVVIPVNSGSEALDLAIRMAQIATGRKGMVAAREGYHGWTMASDAVSTSAYDNPHAAASRPDWVHISEAPNAYRGVHRGEDAGPRYVADIAAQLADLEAAGTPAAAFLCESVAGNAGGVIPPAGYLAGAYDAIRAHGGLAIADEVQVGYGRLGDTFFGHELQGARPDIIAVAKAAGNAYPVGAVITSRKIVEALAREGMFFSSAAGAPASAVAGGAVLDVIAGEGLQANAKLVGERLARGFAALAERHEIIGAVHGTGLYMGVELVASRETLEPATEQTAWVCERLLAHGVIMQATSERQNVLKVKPPMTMTVDEADDFVAALDAVLGELTERSVS